MIPYLAWKNFVFHRKRYLLLVSIVSFSVFFFITMQAFINGMNQGNESGIIDLEIGHYQIALKSKDQEPLPTFTFNEKLLNKLDQIPHIQGVAPRLTVMGQINLQESYYPILVTAIDPVRESKTFQWIKQSMHHHLIQKNEIVMGLDLMKKLNFKINDAISLRLQKDDTFVTHRFIIKDSINTSSLKLNLQSIFIHQDTLSQILGTHLIQAYHIRLDDKKNTKKVLYSLQKAIKSPLKITSWTKFKQQMEEISNSKNVAIYIMVAMILLLGMLGIMNSELLNFHHIQKNMIMLRILGLKKNHIFWFFIFEGMWIGIAGVIIGLFFGALVDFYIIHFGIDIIKYFMENGNTEALEGTGVPIGVIYGYLNLGPYLFISIFSIVIAMMGGIIPGIKARKLNLKELT